MRLRNGKFYLYSSNNSRHHPYKKKFENEVQESKPEQDIFDKQIQELESILETFSNKYSTQNIKMEIISNPVVDDNDDDDNDDNDDNDDDVNDKLVQQDFENRLFDYENPSFSTQDKDNSDNKKEKCKHCPEFLSCGYDKDNLLHCQGCHRVWNGYAQCPCWMKDI